MNRTFKRFPEDMICPLCGTNENKEYCLIPVDNTGNGSICEAQPMHTECVRDISKYRYNKEVGVVYRCVRG